MVKKIKNIYSKICDMDNIRLAHTNAKRDKSFYKEVKMVNSNEDYYLGEIQKMLINKTYKIEESDYKVSNIYDRIKHRKLMKLDYYPHRIVQWAIMLQIGDMFMKTFSYFSCASVPKKGGKLASSLVSKYMEDEEGTKYCLKLDIKKFYPSVNHDILKQLLRRKIGDNELLNLLDNIIDSHPGHKGVPIGSYLSQYLANYYLTFFDHRLKEELRIKYVVRYMDDIVIFGPTKEYLRDIFYKIKEYLSTNLHLVIKHNYQIFPTAIRGVDFVGYRHFYGYKLLRKRTCKKMKKKFMLILDKQNSGKMINYSNWCSANSYIGWILYCNHFRLYSKYITPIHKSLNRYYYYVIKKDKKSLIKYYNKVRNKQYQ